MPESLFNKVAGLRPATLLKKRLWHRCFLVNFVKFLRTPFYAEHLWCVLPIKVKETNLIHESEKIRGVMKSDSTIRLASITARCIRKCENL